MANPFQTPDTEKSFSGLIDAAIMATGKPGSLIYAVQAANLTIRECQAMGLFARDLIEDTLIPTDPTSTTYVWTRPVNFRKLRTAKYTVSRVYPDFILPGKKQAHQCEYFYAADNYFVFSGVPANDTIDIATYYWSTRLAYYGQLGIDTSIFPGGPYQTRPAFYDELLGIWQYLNSDGSEYVDTTGDPDTDAALQKVVSNWLTQDWYDLVLSGTKEKVWRSTGDARGPVEFSSYQTSKKLLQTTSGYEAEGF